MSFLRHFSPHIPTLRYPLASQAKSYEYLNIREEFRVKSRVEGYSSEEGLASVDNLNNFVIYQWKFYENLGSLAMYWYTVSWQFAM